jgi:Ca2+:H+ antiporter
MAKAASIKSKVKILIIPTLAWMAFGIQHELKIPFFDLVLLLMLILSTLDAVKHAEIIAHRIGEPFGTLVLAVAITCIEASMIISMMLAGGPGASSLARDTVFAAVMIILNGMIGLSIIAGSIKHNMQSFVLQGVNATLTALVAISVLTLILPNYTISVPGPSYSMHQLIFVSIVSLIIYGSFVFVQNIRHKHLFISGKESDHSQNNKPTTSAAFTSFVMLLVCLGAVVFLAESLAPGLDNIIDAIGAPHSLVGVIIACIVLLPEGLSAYKAAKKNEIQKSLNLSLGSALASIGLTIPIVSFYSIFSGVQLTLGIDVVSTILFLLSLLITVLSLSTGKTTILQGIILLLVFLVYIFTIIFP